MAQPSLKHLSLSFLLLYATQTVTIRHIDTFKNISATQFVLWSSLFNFLLLFTWYGYIYPTYQSPLRHIPRPKDGWPLLGHGLSFFKRPPAEDYLHWMKTIPNDGLLFFNSFLYQPRILLTNHKTLAEVLVQKSYDFQKPPKVRSFLARVLGNGLIVVEGDEHKFQRKHLMPVFSFRHIKDLYPVMWKKATSLVDILQHEVKHQPVVEINHWATKVTMDIIGIAGLGHEFNALRSSDDPLIQAYEEILEPTAEKVAFTGLNILFPRALVELLPWGLSKRMDVLSTSLKSITTKLVADKRETLRNKKSHDNHFDILSVLIESNDFTDQQLTDQMLTFLGAGHETTSSALTWATYLLASHTSIQDRIRTELQQAQLQHLLSPETSDNPGLSSLEQLASTLESLPLLNAVCNETIRLYPTVPMMIRESVRPTSIASEPIPTGTQILLSGWAINRNPEFWGANADQFVPERWIDKDTGRPNKIGGSSSNYHLMTFLHGPRSCIGREFAAAELRCLVAALVLGFDWVLDNPEAECVAHGAVTIKPKGGMYLRLQPVIQVVK